MIQHILMSIIIHSHQLESIHSQLHHFTYHHVFLAEEFIILVLVFEPLSLDKGTTLGAGITGCHFVDLDGVITTEEGYDVSLVIFFFVMRYYSAFETEDVLITSKYFVEVFLRSLHIQKEDIL